MSTLFALLVGIDGYPAPVPSLKGCVNDVNAVQTFLQQRLDPKPNILTLTNEQATRANVIDAFRSHLGQARSGDRALFFYAGHGSEQPSPGGGKEQTQVLYDSRDTGGFDLVSADRQVLLGELVNRGVHLIAVLDCCHSGSGTRDVAVTRQIPARTVPATPPPIPAITRDLGDSVASGSGTHLALEACSDSETAQEYLAAPSDFHGAFTYSMLQELNSRLELPGYDDLLASIVPRMRRLSSQTPQLDELAGKTRRYTFLGLTEANQRLVRRACFTAYRRWELTDAGSMLGVGNGDTFAIFPAGTADYTVAPLTTATVASVVPQSSVIVVADASKLDPTVAYYEAVATSRAAKTNILLDGDDAGQELIRNAIAASLFVREGLGWRISVTVRDGKFVLDAPMWHGRFPDPLDVSADHATLVAHQLDHIANWIMKLETRNGQSQMTSDLIGFSWSDARSPEEPPKELSQEFNSIDVSYTADGKGPQLRIKIVNQSAQLLYVALLGFQSDWSIYSRVLQLGTQPLNPGDFIYALTTVNRTDGTPIPFSVPAGAQEAHDDLLLIASTDNFAASDFEQVSLAKLMEPTRDMDLGPKLFRNDFITRRLHIHTVRSS